MTTPPPAPPSLALRADLLDFTGEPAFGATDDPAVRWRPDHWLLIGADGRIQAVQAEPPGPAWPREEHPGRLLLPGFIDTHVHSPQLDVLASHGTELLDWLARHTFPRETAWADPALAAAGSARFCDALLAHGTTTAMVVPTVHAHAAQALFEAAAARGMAIVAGKVLMDRHAPAGLLDDPADVAGVERQCLDLIQRWHGHGRARYAVTVRFAPTSTPAQLAMAGALCRADPTLFMQTHLAENRDELRWVAELFPDAHDYLSVYERVGLLHPRAVFAHGIWLSDDERARLAAAGAAVAHCPTSNLFLGSGLFDWPRTRAAGVGIAVASDVGGGTSLNLQRNLAAAYQVQALQGQRPGAWALLHAATRGAARVLGLQDEIGTLEPGAWADVCLWDRAIGPVDTHRQGLARDLHEALFAWLVLSDERHLAATFVAGREAWRRGHPALPG